MLLITFRDFRPTSLEKGQEIYRLRIYEVYAWGVPILITTIAAVLDNLPESSSETFLRPRFGENKCWFYGELYVYIVRMSQYGLHFSDKTKNTNKNKKSRNYGSSKQHKYLIS